MAKVRKIKGREGYFLDYRLKDGTRVIKKASRSNRRGAERELALIVSEMEMKPGLRRIKKITFGKMCDEYFETYIKVNHRDWRTEGYSQPVEEILSPGYLAPKHQHEAGGAVQGS